MDKVFLNKTKYCKDLYSILYEVLTAQRCNFRLESEEDLGDTKMEIP
jgi:hypothetical protein